MTDQSKVGSVLVFPSEPGNAESAPVVGIVLNEYDDGSLMVRTFSADPAQDGVRNYVGEDGQTHESLDAGTPAAGEAPAGLTPEIKAYIASLLGHGGGPATG